MRARRFEIEGRLLQLVTTEMPHDQRRRFVRVACDLLIEVIAGPQRCPGILVDVGPGGVFVQTALTARTGDAVAVVCRGGKDGALYLHGTVVWVQARLRKRLPVA